MRVRTPADLGALIRDRRTNLRLDQKSLGRPGWRKPPVDCGSREGQAPRRNRPVAAHLGCARNNPRQLEKEEPGKLKDKSLSHGVDAHVDIDSIVASARRKRK